MASRKNLKDSQFVPGPGQYNPSVDYAKENLGGIKIGTSKRSGNKELENVPGPGNYQAYNSIGLGPGFGFGTGSRSGNSKE